jgi:hypothetical protein
MTAAMVPSGSMTTAICWQILPSGPITPTGAITTVPSFVIDAASSNGISDNNPTMASLLINSVML